METNRKFLRIQGEIEIMPTIKVDTNNDYEIKGVISLPENKNSITIRPLSDNKQDEVYKLEPTGFFEITDIKNKVKFKGKTKSSMSVKIRYALELLAKSEGKEFTEEYYEAYMTKELSLLAKAIDFNNNK